MLDWNDCPAVERIPGKVSGEWLFRSTRVSVRALFENLEGGASVAEFLEWFPGVTREQVDTVWRVPGGLASRSACRMQSYVRQPASAFSFVR